MKFLTTLIITSLITISAQAAKKQSDAQIVKGLQKSCKTAGKEMGERQKKEPLFNRLGGREKIKTLSANIYAAHKANQKIGHMFAHVSAEPFISNVTEFLVVGTGGQGHYTGRDMPTAHKHLKITNADFLSAGDDVQNVMKSMNYGQNEIQEVVCALVSFVPVVVKK